jgi:hypothetical protein
MFGRRTRLGARRRRRMAPRIASFFGGPRPRRRDRSGVDEPARWRSRPGIRIVAALTGLVALAFIMWLGWVVYLYVVRNGPSGATYDPDRRCGALGFSCGIATNILASGVLVALASTFVLWRLFGLQRRYRTRAQSDSRELVPTAGAIIDQVVGRDELCMAVMTDLHDRTARPHVIVGGVGTGKTAVLVRLTEYLAEKRAIPVPIKLRDAATELDFEAMARARFLSEVNPGLISAAEGETIWRRLRKDGKIIVLADGLEEAIVGTAAEPERDNIIREAIRRARQHHLPLVIASRPHDPLRATDAAILNLEPLSFEAALAYVGSDGTTDDERRLAWIVETADVVEAPLYLQITRELHVKGLLEPTAAGQLGVLDTRGVDRAKLRLSLLETWERALISGHLREEIPLNRAERQAALEHMSALACAGLRADTLEVAFEVDLGSQLQDELAERLAKIDEQTGQTPGVRNVDVRLAAAWAAQLNLVEVRGHSIRFPHSLMQAYLGSRMLDVAVSDPDYMRDAMRFPRPGREFVIAMVLRSRAVRSVEASGAVVVDRRGSARRLSRAPLPEPTRPPDFLAPLRKSAGSRDDNKVLDMFAAALEIDCLAETPAHEAIGAQIRERWQSVHAQDPRTLEEGKRAVVHRFGEAARMIDDRVRRGDRIQARPAYGELFTIGCGDRSYAVQLAGAQEIGAGGETAYEVLRGDVAAPCPVCAGERSQRPEHPSVDRVAPSGGGRRAGAGGKRADRAGRSGGGADATDLSARDRGQDWSKSAESSRAAVISAWLAPMLVGSIGGRGSSPADRVIAEHAQEDLSQWLRHVGLDGRLNGEQDLPIALEIALAQGFKYAANRRPAQPDLLRESRMFLAEQALEMLKGARYWFSQLTLIHALTLLNLSETKQPWDKYGARPEAIVQHWLDVAGRERPDRDRTGADRPPGARYVPHPFVREAALLCVLALKTERPQRYLWIDESGVVGQVGSRNLSKMEQQKRHRLWIPPSAGWTALNGRAQQLVADVLLLRNLADRGELPHERERRLRRSNRGDLPPCITHYREALEPALTVGTAVSIVPGVSCVDGCVFELCPYPPKGVQPRVEMSEAFCRRQLTLLDRSLRHPLTRQAPWQQMTAGQLRAFWTQMADRARGPRPQPAKSDRRRRR